MKVVTLEIDSIQKSTSCQSTLAGSWKRQAPEGGMNCLYRCMLAFCKKSVGRKKYEKNNFPRKGKNRCKSMGGMSEDSTLEHEHSALWKVSKVHKKE